MCSGKDDTALPVPGFPIRTSPDLRLFGDYPELFAACHVLPRLLSPRHPPHALIILAVKTFATLCSFQGASGSRHKLFQPWKRVFSYPVPADNNYTSRSFITPPTITAAAPTSATNIPMYGEALTPPPPGLNKSLRTATNPAKPPAPI